jgi:hypothetical protein
MSDATDTADYYVTQGADSANGQITAIWPKDKPTHSPRIPNLKNGIDSVPSESGLSTGRIQQLRLADVVFIVGGNAKTKEILPLCIALEKPFLPIPQFDGAAREIRDRLVEILEGQQNRDLLEIIKNLSRRRISESTNRDELGKAANDIVRLLERITKDNPIAKENVAREIKSLLFVLGSAAIAVAGGWLSYRNQSLLPILLSLLGAIAMGSFLAVYFGSGYGAAGAAKIVRNSSRGAIVSIATLVLILFAQFPTTGKIDPIVDSGGDYVRIAIVVFLIGFGCAWRYEPWEDSLRRRFEEFRRKQE